MDPIVGWDMRAYKAILMVSVLAIGVCSVAHAVSTAAHGASSPTTTVNAHVTDCGSLTVSAESPGRSFVSSNSTNTDPFGCR